MFQFRCWNLETISPDDGTIVQIRPGTVGSACPLMILLLCSLLSWNNFFHLSADSAIFECSWISKSFGGFFEMERNMQVSQEILKDKRNGKQFLMKLPHFVEL